MKKSYKKIILFLSLCFSVLIGLTVSSHAYYYDSDTGNLESSNLLNLSYSNSQSGVSLLLDSSVLTVNGTNNTGHDLYFYKNLFVDCTIGNTYTLSFDTDVSISYDCWLNGNRYLCSNIVNLSFTLTQELKDSNWRFVVPNSSYNNSIVNIMLNSGSSALDYEPYGTFYSQTNYENYGASQYSQGYTDGFNSIYNSLIDVNLSEHVTGVGCGIYNSTGTTFVQNGTITSVYFENNYYHLEVAPIIDGNYYVIPITFDNNYIFSSFRWTPNRLSSPSLTINGVIYDSSSVGYNGSTYGWDNLNVNLDTATNYIEFKFKIYSNFEFINLYINGKNLEIASALESYQSGYDNGKNVGYQNGYNDGFTAGTQSVTTDNTNFQKLIWTIGSTPFESFKTIFDVDVMGLNISGIILGGLMALLVLYLIKKIWK